MFHNKKYIVTFIITIALSFAFIFIGEKICPFNSVSHEELTFDRAKVTEITNVTENSYTVDNNMSSKRIEFKAKVLSGEFKGQTFTMYEDLDGMSLPQPYEVEKGDRIIVTYDLNIYENSGEWQYVNHDRTFLMYILIGGFFLLILLIGRSKGIGTLISLVFTVLAVFKVYIPSILFGKNIYASTIIISVFIILMSLIIINGLSKKTICAILGNLGGLLVAGILALIMDKAFQLTGIIDQNYAFLTMLDNGVSIDLVGVVWGGIVIGSLGAVMDVSMSIASSMNELSETMSDKSYSRMVKSGMNIGRDAIGTMTNTLILAYVGGSLALVLLYVVYSKNFVYLINREVIIVEVLKAVIGSMGILFAVPVTVLIAGKIFNKKNKKEHI